MGLGISIVTAICLTEADRQRLAARSLAQWFPSRSYGIVMRKGKFLSPQARAFVELIQPEALATRGYDESGHSER
jgi:DNA-binding transcriptional LysR family regulator